MQAFMAGKVRVEGDMTKLLAFQAAPPSPSEADVSAQIREITAT
jgi:putative sterol carrier protein